MGDTVTWNKGSNHITASTHKGDLVFKRNGTDWLHVGHAHLHAYLKSIITDALINRSESGFLKPFVEEKGIPTKNSSPMKDPGENFVFEANGDLLFQGYLVLEAAHLPRVALELAKYAFEKDIFASEESFETWAKGLH